MARGAVKWFHAIMRYGFIAPDDGSTSVRIGRDVAIDRLRPGALVEYDTAPGPDGQLRAVNLRTVDDEEAGPG